MSRENFSYHSYRLGIKIWGEVIKKQIIRLSGATTLKKPEEGKS